LGAEEREACPLRKKGRGNREKKNRRSACTELEDPSQGPRARGDDLLCSRSREEKVLRMEGS